MVDSVDSWLVPLFFFGLILTGLGFIFALPVLVPPFNRWLRQERKRRVTAVLLFGLFLGLTLFLTLAYFGAQIGALGRCYEFSEFGAFYCGSDTAVRLSFTSSEELRTAIGQELFWRSITPPPFRLDCYADNPAFCDFIDPSPNWDFYMIWPGLFFYGWPLLVLWLLIWWWTRPYPTPKTGEET